MLVAHDAPRQVLAGELAALEVEGVAVAVVRRRAEDADAAVVLEPAQLPVVGDVAPHQVAALGIPRQAIPIHSAPGPQSLDGAVGLPQRIEARIDREDVGIGEVGRGCAARAEVARRRRDGGRRCDRARASPVPGRKPVRRRGCCGHADQRRPACDATASLPPFARIASMQLMSVTPDGFIVV